MLFRSCAPRVSHVSGRFASIPMVAPSTARCMSTSRETGSAEFCTLGTSAWTQRWVRCIYLLSLNRSYITFVWHYFRPQAAIRVDFTRPSRAEPGAGTTHLEHLHPQLLSLSLLPRRCGEAGHIQHVIRRCRSRGGTSPYEYEGPEAIRLTRTKWTEG